MVVRFFHTVTVLALVGTVTLLAFCADLWLDQRGEPELVDSPPIIHRVREHLMARGAFTERDESPLVTQARAFASYLNPPSAPKSVAPRRDLGVQQVPAPRVHASPLALSPNFKLQGTVYCTEQPQTSMALVSMGHGPATEKRWVKEGSQLGHYVVQEIRPNAIICRELNGEQVREISIEAKPPRPPVVQRCVPALANAGLSSSLGATKPDMNGVSDGTP